MCYHVVNRGNARARVYHDPRDYTTFVHLIARACIDVPMRVLAYCLMPNHFHLVVWPFASGDLSRWMHWLLTTHVVLHHRRHGTSGRIWQGRYKAFPIQADHHLLTVMRYVERNAARAGLAETAESWRWSSVASWNHANRADFLVAGPVPRPQDWIQRVNESATDAELAAIRMAVKRSRPFGTNDWIVRTAKALHIESTLRNRGRPRRKPLLAGVGYGP
jgi:putative transposase